MTKYLLLWERDMTAVPGTLQEQLEIDKKLTDMVVEELESGSLLDWGLFAGGLMAGYAICEGDELDISMSNMRYVPHVVFTAFYPILSVQQTMKMLEAAMQG